MMRKKENSNDHSSQERWLVSYADLVTLLFAFFVILYASSEANLSKLKKVSEGMQSAFKGVEPGKLNESATMPEQSFNAPSGVDQKFSELKLELNREIALLSMQKEMRDEIQILDKPDGLLVRIAIKSLYLRGSADVASDYQMVLQKIGKVISKGNLKMEFEGHAETGEYVGSSFQSDWELSYSRAYRVVKEWVSTYALSPNRFKIVGYGSTHPIEESEEKEWFSSSNRRIEILIKRNDSNEI